MKVVLEQVEAEEYFHTALCNALGEMRYYGLDLDFDEEAYKTAKAKLTENANATCYEDVLIQMLKDGGTLTMVDEEGDGEWTRTITIKEVHDRVASTPIRHLMDMINENDDATTGDVLLQTVFFNEVIFG
jgi:hypothetical protein